MTNRRRSGKGRTSTSKKADSAEKPSRKLTRRGKRTKKSESPEKPQDSDYSGDEQSEERDSKEVDRDEVIFFFFLIFQINLFKLV